MSDNWHMTKATEKRSERITIRLPATVRAAIERAAARDRRTVSDWIVLTLTDSVKGLK